MFCTKCGKQIADTAKFCPFCGNTLDQSAEDVKVVPGALPHCYGSEANNPQLIGFSGAYMDPRINEFKEKKKRSSGGCLFSFAAAIPIVVAVVCIISMIVGETDLEGLLLITGLSLIPAAVLLLIGLIQKAHARREKPMWEGVVLEKGTEKVRDYHADKHHSETAPHYYTLYNIYARTDSGENKKFSFADDPEMYGYYQPGDRVRYHPVLEYYEKYDKSHDNLIYCACCGQRNPIKNNKCQNCGMPLFK